jgi:GxxExxY protein
MLENEISYKIRGAIFNVYKAFGPGLFESVYVAALGVELKNQGLNCEYEVPISVDYQGEQLGLGFRIDILVNKKVIIEVKSVENLAEVHHKQILTYLKLTNIKLGILVNFNEENINDGIHRKVNGL